MDRGLAFVRRTLEFRPRSRGFVTSRGVADLRSFVHAVYIHNGGYAGGFVGLILALFNLYTEKKKLPSTYPDI